MSGTYKMITLVGTSPKSFADAVNNAILTANRSVRGISWFEVDEMRGRVVDGEVDEFQVTIRAGFKVEGGTTKKKGKK